MLFEVALHVGGEVVSFLERHKGDNRLALELVRHAHHRRLGHRGMIHESAFNLHGANTMSGHAQNVIYATEQGEVAVSATLGAVSGKIGANIPLRPIGFLEALRVAPDAAQH